MKRLSIYSFVAALVASLPLCFAEPLKVGDKAPNFELKGSDGKTYKLSDFQGKKPVVVAWFPKAFTPGCTKSGAHPTWSDTTMGSPHDMASPTDSPNPSRAEGKRKTSASR